MGDKSCRFTVELNGHMLLLRLGTGLDAYQFPLSFDEAKSLSRVLAEASDVAEHAYLDHVNDKFEEATKISYHKKMMEAEQMRHEMNAMEKNEDFGPWGPSPLHTAATKHLARKYADKIEREYAEYVFHVSPDKIASFDEETPQAKTDDEPIAIDIELAEEGLKELFEGIEAMGVAMVGKAPETGRLPQGGKENFQPEPVCICFGPPVDDCPIHGKKK